MFLADSCAYNKVDFRRALGNKQTIVFQIKFCFPPNILGLRNTPLPVQSFVHLARVLFPFTSGSPIIYQQIQC